MYGEKIKFKSNATEGTLVDLSLKDEEANFSHYTTIKVNNSPGWSDAYTSDSVTCNDLVVTFQYSTDSGTTYADITSDGTLNDYTVAKGAVQTFNVYLPEGSDLRILGQGNTEGWIEVGRENSNSTYRPSSPLHSAD